MVCICGKYRVILSSAAAVRVAEKLGALSTTTAWAPRASICEARLAGGEILAAEKSEEGSIEIDASREERDLGRIRPRPDRVRAATNRVAATSER